MAGRRLQTIHFDSSMHVPDLDQSAPTTWQRSTNSNLTGASNEQLVSCCFWIFAPSFVGRVTADSVMHQPPQCSLVQQARRNEYFGLKRPQISMWLLSWSWRHAACMSLMFRQRICRCALSSALTCSGIQERAVDSRIFWGYSSWMAFFESMPAFGWTLSYTSAHLQYRGNNDVTESRRVCAKKKQDFLSTNGMNVLSGLTRIWGNFHVCVTDQSLGWLVRRCVRWFIVRTTCDSNDRKCLTLVGLHRIAEHRCEFLWYDLSKPSKHMPVTIP